MKHGKVEVQTTLTVNAESVKPDQIENNVLLNGYAVISYVDSVLNMTLQSNSFTAEAQPDIARIVIFEEDVDSITLNTDLIASISRDGGTTFTNVTLVDEGNYESGKQILAASVDISGQPSGTSMEYKLITANTKDLKIHGVGLSWD